MNVWQIAPIMFTFLSAGVIRCYGDDTAKTRWTNSVNLSYRCKFIIDWTSEFEIRAIEKNIWSCENYLKDI